MTNHDAPPPEICPRCNRRLHLSGTMTPGCIETVSDTALIERGERVKALERKSAAVKKKAGIYERLR